MCRKHPARSGGFTLIEIVMLLVVSGIVLTVVFQILLGQSQFARLTSAREEVQQNARSSTELISSELRAITPHSIEAAERSMLRFYQPRVWGLLCRDVRVDPQATEQVVARFPGDVVPADFRLATRHWGVGIGRTGDPAAAPDAYGHFVPQFAGSAGSSCDDALGAAAGAMEYAVVVRPPDAMSVPFASVAGSRIYLYEETGYRSAGGWLERMIGYSEDARPKWEPLAGPLVSESGLEFRYYREDGSEITTTPVPPALLASIASVRVSVRTQSTAKTGYDHRQQNHASTLISFRNR
jgi:type II secretory pathway pseudopilin PulG